MGLVNAEVNNRVLGKGTSMCYLVYLELLDIVGLPHQQQNVTGPCSKACPECVIVQRCERASACEKGLIIEGELGR